MKTVKTLILSTCLVLALSLPALAITTFNQGFETDTDGWIPNQSSVTRVASGTGGIASSDGAFHAVIAPNATAPTGAFTRFDGYKSVWPQGGFTASLDVYLDTDWTAGSGFDYSVAASNTGGNHLRDFIFHVAKDSSTGSLLVGATNNSNGSTRENLETLSNNRVVSQTGWYTFQHMFFDQGGSLAVKMDLIDSLGESLFSETRSTTSDQIASVVGGNRYGWFTFADVDSLNIDNSRLDVGAPVPEPSTFLLMGAGLAGLALYRRRKNS